ncbi:MAG TPA: hypothetical protein IAA26_02925 [Candidatus Blautia faecipullorum]|nr:hypothetical protein [Candidatus Blautia faecipullorum]
MDSGKEYKTSEIAAVLGVKESRARLLMNGLAEEGKIRAIGKNKGRKYTIL